MLNPKFKVGQLVYFICENRLHSRDIGTIVIVENKHDDWDATDEQKKAFTPFGKSRIEYYICGDLFFEHQLFATKQELVDDLLKD